MGQYKPQSAKTKTTCYKCNKEGHMAKDCWSKVQAKVNSVEQLANVSACGKEVFGLLSVLGYVNDIKMSLSLDSGATVSVMSSKMVTKHKLTIIPSDIQVRVANNYVSKIIGVTENVSVEVQGHVCKLSFIIMDHEDHDALLGLDWFNETGACLCPATKTLTFPSEKIIYIRALEPQQDLEPVTPFILRHSCLPL